MAAAALTLSTAGNAATNLITNGSFELGTNPGVFTSLVKGSSAITGWTIGGSSVDYIGTYWQAADGVRSLDLSGSTAKNGSYAGSVSQVFDTAAGHTYNVSFYLAGNPDGNPLTKIAVSRANDGLDPAADPLQLYTNTFTVLPGTNTRTNMGWKQYSFQFTAVSAKTKLTFESGVNTPFGAALDNVSVLGVPEPAVWGMMIAGFGIVGFQSRRRRSIKTVTA
jgi:choice-of-anchor C domain-containing protein